MPIENCSEGATKFPEGYDKAMCILIEGGLSQKEANELIVDCANKFALCDIEEFLDPALSEYLKQNPPKGKALDRKDIEMIEDALAKMLLSKLKTKSGTEPNILYTGPGGVKLTENSNN